MPEFVDHGDEWQLNRLRFAPIELMFTLQKRKGSTYSGHEAFIHFFIASLSVFQLSCGMGLGSHIFHPCKHPQKK